MGYLVYQLERGENGTLHFQGYCELKSALRLSPLKTLMGSDSIHIEQRRGTAEQARDYCMKDDTRVEDSPVCQHGEMKITKPGKRNDLKAFMEEVRSGEKRKRDLVEDHYGTIARYPKFYDTLTLMHRPTRTVDLEVILHIGDTGLGKTRVVMDAHAEDQDFYIAPLSNGTPWYDHYDQHRTVLLDDFSGASSHMSLVTLLRLLDRYPVMVPTKGSHTWWLPNRIYVTTNLLPKEWYKWENRGEHYRALARRFTKVVMFYIPLSPSDPGHVDQGPEWWKENAPQEAINLYGNI